MAAVHTIGYEGTTIDRFVATLVAADINTLVDVRAVAISRKKGFSKNALRTALNEAGIEYLHLVDLGDPKEGRLAARAGKYDRFRKIFSTHLNSKPARAAMTTLNGVVVGSNACLMCFECDPAGCHRNIIAEELARNGILIVHLHPDSGNNHVRGKHLSSGNHHQGCPTRQ